MHHDPATIDCPNPACQAPNPESHKFCQQCRTAIPKRYLWATGQSAETARPGDLLGGRYLVKQNQVVLDTQPGLLPEATPIDAAIEPYLRLVPWSLHVPQVYGLVVAPRKRAAAILLLEQAPIYPDGVALGADSQPGLLMPELADVWKQSTAFRQLHWLWQIAQLWQPLATEGVASTLLTPEVLRVEGSLVRLLELRADHRDPPTLSDLGQVWRRWQPKAQPEIADFMGEFCQQMIRGQVRSAEQLVALLDRALAVCGQAQSRQIQLVTRTDQGPTRQRNEDACFPPSGTLLEFPVTANGSIAVSPDRSQPLVIVCDGIGGHEGGNVASKLAIELVQQQLQPLLASTPGTIDATTLTLQLEQAALAANDAIAKRNDAEQRQERQRMGTTLVMAIVQAHELYLAHVGDSRAYWITRTGCHQVTLDDDLATREVRLGYAFYRSALQQPGSGSLVQALGMGASAALHPTVQRFVLDEDCLFLLCSDGLSDHDRIEEHWQTELLPVLEGKVDLVTASQRLVTLANRQNGHDNVTVGLIACRTLDTAQAALPLPVPLNFPAVAPKTLGRSDQSATVLSAALPRRSLNPLGRLLGMLILWLLGGTAVYFLLPEVRAWVDAIVGNRLPLEALTPASPIAASPRPSTSPVTPASPAGLAVGSLVRVSRSALNDATPAPLTLHPQPAKPISPTTSAIAPVPVGAVLQVTNRAAIAQNGVWLKLKVCSIPTATATLQVAQPSQTGWLAERQIAPLLVGNLTLTARELGECVPTLKPAPE